MSDTADEFTVSELVEYCHTQAQLLQGRVETLDEETADLLADIDADISSVRAQLDEAESASTSHSTSPTTPDGAGQTGDLSELEAMEDNLAEQQAVVRAKQARRAAFVELSAAYLDLAESLQTDSAGVEAALKRLLQFEQDQDAPAYFEEQVTLLEAATDSE